MTNRRWSKRGWLLFALLLGMAGLLAGIAATEIARARNARDEGWVPAGSVDSIRDAGIVYLKEYRVFVVPRGRRFLAISEAVPHLPGETAMFCRSSGWFESPYHGEKFDRYGRYVSGPASRGLDRFEVRVLLGEIQFRPEGLIPGPPRGGPTLEPEGPFCVGRG